MARIGREPKIERNQHAEHDLRIAGEAHKATSTELRKALRQAVKRGVPIARAARLAGIARGTAYKWLDQ